jgi:uncharacterized membrane protein
VYPYPFYRCDPWFAVFVSFAYSVVPNASFFVVRLGVQRFASKVVAIVVFVAALLALQTVARACPTCGQALGHDTAHAGMAKGFYYSILFMMATPYVVLCTFCGCMYWKVRRVRAERALKADPPKSATPSESAIASSPAVSQRADSREPVEV